MKKGKDKKEATVFEKLIPKHQMFVKEYIANGGVGRKAYMAVYPNIKKGDTADAAASRLLRNVRVKKAVEEEYIKIWADKDKDIEKGKTYQMIHILGSSDIFDVVEIKEKGEIRVKDLSEIPTEARQAIQSIEYEEKEGKSGGIDKNIKVKLHPKLQALELRSRIQKMIEKENLPIEIIITPAKRPEKAEETAG